MTIRGTNGYFGRAAFTAYLKQLPAEQVVGERGSGLSCPLTVFIKHIAPEARSVDTTVGYITMGYFSHETPQWACDFINHIDGRTLRDQFQTSNSVTAAEALAALKQ